jgi:hypothetical protein
MTTPTTLRDPAATLNAAVSPTPGAGGATGGDAPAPVAFQGLTVTRCAGEGWGCTGTLDAFPLSSPDGEGGAVPRDEAAPPEPFEWETTPTSTPEQDRRDEQEQARRPF